jgi:2-polyprenyl-3-methyl-5-hydroxy-6-metoxy-1,4-benzoquinol methylase
MDANKISINKDITVMHDWESDATLEKFCDIMNQPDPLFFARLGGSDYNCVQDYYNNKTIVKNASWYEYHYHRVKSHNGYFDFENTQENFVEYLEIMTRCYKDSNAFTYANDKLIRSFGVNQFIDTDADFINYLCKDKVCINYTFIEGLAPFLKSLTHWATGKKILIISPLSQSIEYQYKHKNNLYRNYILPDFELLTYNTKITYSDENDTQFDLNVSTNNWLEEATRMSHEISKLDFDIALLSCGSYAMYLGDYIKNNLKKKSLYLGGILNMLFNIYGGRYNQRGYIHLGKSVGLDPEYQINPFENKDIENIKSGRNFKTESLKAYFGTNTAVIKSKNHTMDNNQTFWEQQHNIGNVRTLSGCTYEDTVDFLNVKDLIFPGMRVLEIGCGLGYVTQGFSEKVKISVLDISQTALDRVRSMCENVYHINDVETLPTNYFDLIICHNVVQHVPTASLRVELANTIRSLKDSGTFAIEYVWANDIEDNGVNFEPLWATAGHLCRSDKFMMDLVQELGGTCKISRTNSVPRHKKIHGLTVLHITKDQNV